MCMKKQSKNIYKIQETAST
uniref:Uncharacterized protein n=1 Tax=Rhizophora mucronata TaxID=61149 RepID=A0A2P2IVC9_RHIMU